MPAPTRERERVSAIVDTADSPLGRWTMARWTPPEPSPLAPAVQQFWYFDGTIAKPKERVFPDGSAELVVMLDEPHRDGDADPVAPFPAVCINGLRTRPSVVVAPAGRCRVLGIRFSPIGACALLRESIKDLLDVTIDLRAALGRAADELAERCAEAASTSAWNPQRNAVAVLQAAVEWTTRRVDGDRATADAVVTYLVEEVRKASGAVSLDAIRTAVGLPRSRLAERFRNHVGITPKRFARIVRFHKAISILGSAASLSHAAAEVAYYDQAHMYRDFEEFARMTPGEFLSASRYSGTPSLAET